MREGAARANGPRPPRWDVRAYESLDSTNLEARRLLAAGASPGLVVVARHQSGGRGRLGRGWLDLPGKSLLVSLALEGVGGPEPSVLVALSARAAIVAQGGVGPRLKWPNDLVYGRAKAGGILSEACRSAAAPRGADLTVVGLGLNVAYLPGELGMEAKLPPTSLLIEEGMIWDPADLLQALLRELEARWGKARGEWMREYREHLAFRGETVKVRAPYALSGGAGGTEDFAAVLQGVDEAGNLLLAAGGRTLRLASGDVLPA